MSHNPGIEKVVEDLQILEQQLQSILMEKQTMQVQVNEAENAINELSETNDEVYKILGGVMIRASKEKLIKELEEKKKILFLRVSSIEKQEEIVAKKSEELRNKIRQSLTANKK